MTQPVDPRPLHELLDAAGKDVQPTVPGWQALPTRLANIPQTQTFPQGRWATLPIGIATVASIALVVELWMMRRQPLQAQELPVTVERQSVDLTVLSASGSDAETLYMPVHNMQQPAQRTRGSNGQALVKDRRLILHLKAGDNVVKFTDIAATIDPTSVRFESLTDPKGTTVVEQSFEYDLATADALLKRFIDRQIVCVDKSGPEIAGYLASYDDATIVLASAPKGAERTTQNVRRGSLQALRLPEMPVELIVKPTLVWKLRTKTPGRHETLLTYICGYVTWHADYVIEVASGDAGKPDLVDLNGWVTLENTSGSTYPQAGLHLIAGDVRQVRDPWRRLGERSDLKYGLFNISVGVFDDGKSTKFIQQSLFDYHLYTLNAPCTIADHQIKQLSLLKKTGAKATRRYVFDPRDGQRNLAIDLLVENEEENKLGVPLPKGAVTLQQRGQDGELAVVGNCQIDHTAVKEELKLRYGHAFDVIGDHREVLVETINRDRRITYETRIRNHKPTAVTVRCYAVPLGPNSELLQSALPHLVEDSQNTYFEFTLPANAEQVVRYTVIYRSTP